MASAIAPTASIIVIGNEILSGQTQDVNIHFLARRLHDLGILLMEARIIADIEEDIIAAANACRQRYTYVFTTGGIGPTHDDITAAAIARAFELPLVCNREAAKRLFQRYPSHEAQNARMKMSEMPEGATLIDNPLSTAPGFQVENVFVMAGIPSIMQAMFESIASTLKHGPKRHVRIIAGHVGEGLIAHALAQIQQDHPDIEIGSYPSWLKAGDKGLRIVLRGYCLDELTTAQDKVMQVFQSHGDLPELLTD
jgi:molybdenum cofactor synthesis domain-containing protein